MPRDNWLIIGISGATCSGKTTLSKKLEQAFPNSVLLHQDDYFLDVNDSRHTIIPELNHINFEILSSLDNDAFLNKIKKIVESNPPNLLILDGFLIFNDLKVAEMCDLKFFITLDEEICRNRRFLRVYEPPDPPGYYEQIVWPQYLQHFKQVEQNIANVLYLSGAENIETLFNHAFNVINAKLSE